MHVPEGWEIKYIKNVCSQIIDCVNKTAPIVENVTPYRMIRTSNIRHGKIDLQSVNYVDEKTYNLWTRRGKPKVGDVILTREAPVGEVGLLKDAEGVFLGQRTIMYRVNKEKLNNYFLLYSLLSTYCQRQIELLSIGGTVAHIRVPDCGKIKILIPPLAEQEKIAEILSTWDQTIEQTERLKTNAEIHKKALMQQLLTGKKRFPEFGGEWIEKALGDIAKIAKGQQKNRTDLIPNGQYPVINGGIEPSGYTDEYNRVENIITISEGGNSCGYVNFIKTKFWCGGHCYSILEPKIDNFFLFHALKFCEEALMRLRVGSGLPNIQKRDVDSFKVVYPQDIEEQQKIASVLNTADREIELLTQKIEHLKSEKRALMQQLLTGKRRVKVDG